MDSSLSSQDQPFSQTQQCLTLMEKNQEISIRVVELENQNRRLVALQQQSEKNYKSKVEMLNVKEASQNKLREKMFDDFEKM